MFTVSYGGITLKVGTWNVREGGEKSRRGVGVLLTARLAKTVEEIERHITEYWW